MSDEVQVIEVDENETEPVTPVESTPESNEDSLFARLWERFEALLPDGLKRRSEPGFSVRKALDGQWRWVATFTNNFLDRDGEIISEKALDNWLERVEMKLVPMPELWEAHVPGTRIGQADMVFGVGNFLVATGTFDDTPTAKESIRYYSKHSVPLSHGFTFPRWGLKNGVYESVNIFEVSTLPPPLVASNPYTDFEVNSMKQISAEQQAALARLHGKDYVDKLVTDRLTESEELKAAGVAYKDSAETTPEDAEAEKATGNLAALLSDLAEGQKYLLDQLTTIATAQADKAKADAGTGEQIKALTERIGKLEAFAAQTPKAASAAAETVITETKAKDIIVEQAGEIDPFWKV